MRLLPVLPLQARDMLAESLPPAVFVGGMLYNVNPHKTLYLINPTVSESGFIPDSETIANVSLLYFLSKESTCQGHSEDS